MANYKQYLKSDWPSSLDSFEGVPDIFEPRVRPESSPGWRARAHGALGWIGAIIPGIVLAAALAYLGKNLTDWIGIQVLRVDRDRGSPVSPIMLAIVLGIAIRNSIGVPQAYEQGLRFSIKTILPLGIILLGLKLTIDVIADIGKVGIPIIIACIATALVAVTFINRLLGLPQRLGTLIAVGTSICGVSAIAATAPVIEAEEDETSYAIACVTLFGLLALFTYPFIAHVMFPDNPTAVGLFLGTSIHDTAQVAGAALMYKQQYGQEDVLKVATAIKLMRNLGMSLLIPLMAVWYRRSTGTTATGTRRKWRQIVPLFVIAFALMAVLRSIGDMHERPFGFVSRAAWTALIRGADTTAVWCLTTAMAAIGLGTGLARLSTLGWKPFSVGFAAALLVGVMSASLVQILARFL